MLTCTTGSPDELPAPAGPAGERDAAERLDRAGAAAAPNTGVGAGSKAPLDGGDCGDGTTVSVGSAAMRVCRDRTGSGADTSAGRSTVDDATGRPMTGDGVGAAAPIGAGCTAARGKSATARGGAATGSTADGATCDPSAIATTGACGKRVGTVVGATVAAEPVSRCRGTASPSSDGGMIDVRCDGSNSDGKRGTNAVSLPRARAASRSRKSLMTRTAPDRPAGGAGSS